jgi:hypothetical protein
LRIYGVSPAVGFEHNGLILEARGVVSEKNFNVPLYEKGRSLMIVAFVGKPACCKTDFVVRFLYSMVFLFRGKGSISNFYEGSLS